MVGSVERCTLGIAIEFLSGNDFRLCLSVIVEQKVSMYVQQVLYSKYIQQRILYEQST